MSLSNEENTPEDLSSDSFSDHQVYAAMPTMHKASSDRSFCIFRIFTLRRWRFNSQTLWLQVADAEQSTLYDSLHLPTATEGDDSLSSGKSEAKRDPMCRMLPFSHAHKKSLVVGNVYMKHITQNTVSKRQWRNYHVPLKKHQATILKLNVLHYIAQNKVLIPDAVTFGNASVDFRSFIWIKWQC